MKLKKSMEIIEKSENYAPTYLSAYLPTPVLLQRSSLRSPGWPYRAAEEDNASMGGPSPHAVPGNFCGVPPSPSPYIPGIAEG